VTDPASPSAPPNAPLSAPLHTAEDVDPDDIPVADGAFGGELLSALDPMLLASSLSRTITPAGLMRAVTNLAQKAPGLLQGLDDQPLPPKDWRFSDSTWTDNPVYKRWALAYLAWEKEMMDLVDNDQVDWRTRERSRLVMGVLTSAIAPTNSLPGNPAAIKAAFTTGGRSLWNGGANFLRDLVTNRGLPAQVDDRAFVVGRDVAASPGWVVHRTPMFELIQFTPDTPTVAATPLMLLPPAVNKYYFWDLAPGRSLVEYAVSRGIQVFTMVWRDPRPENGTWGIDNYLASAVEALDVVCDITGQPAAHVFGDCSGGMFLAMLLGYQAATGRHTAATGTFGVTVFDFGEPGGIGIAASDEGLAGVSKRAERGEVISADSISDTFVWMRPNDLVWRYLVDDWLLGKQPPAFDIMFWNADGQGLPSQLAAELTQMSLENALVKPGGMTILGESITLSEVTIDTYQIAGMSDHISPWKGCYAGARALAGQNTFVLTPTGHVQSIIYPPDKPRASFWTNPHVGPNPDEWHAAATRHQGSWWGHWVDWMLARTSGTRPAPPAAGNATHPPIAPAPGRYVLGE